MADLLDTDMGLIYQDGQEYKATPYFEDYLFKIINSLGGEGAPSVVDTETKEVNTHAMAASIKSILHRLGGLEDEVQNHRLEASVKQIEIDTAGFKSLVKSINYTAENKDWVEGRANIQIDLPKGALVNDQVMVSNGDGSTIKVFGNGYNIKYTSTDTTFITSKIGSSYHFQLFDDGTEKYWRAR